MPLLSGFVISALLFSSLAASLPIEPRAPSPSPLPAPNDIDSLLSRILTQIGNALPTNAIPASLRDTSTSGSTIGHVKSEARTSPLLATPVVLKNPKAIPNPKLKPGPAQIKRQEELVLSDSDEEAGDINEEGELRRRDNLRERELSPRLVNPKAAKAAATAKTASAAFGPTSVVKVVGANPKATAIPNGKFTPTYVAKPVTGYPRTTHPGEPHTTARPKRWWAVW